MNNDIQKVTTNITKETYDEIKKNNWKINHLITLGILNIKNNPQHSIRMGEIEMEIRRLSSFKDKSNQLFYDIINRLELLMYP